MSGRLMENKEAGEGRGWVVWEKRLGGHINPSTKAPYQMLILLNNCKTK